MGLLRNIKKALGIEKRAETPSRGVGTEARAVSRPSAADLGVGVGTAPAPTPAMPAPSQRRVIEAPLIKEEAPVPEDPNAVIIKAQPSAQGDECRFLLDRKVIEGFSWYFANAGAAKGSPLVEAIFAAEGDVATVLLFGSTVTITRADRYNRNWKPLAEAVGAAMRKVIQGGGDLVDPALKDRVPGEEEIRKKVLGVIESEINPGVAAHDGQISLTGVTGNSITIHMGGGCQGCSAAGATLREGIEMSLRRSIPELGAVFDVTDHAAGENPYFRG